VAGRAAFPVANRTARSLLALPVDRPERVPTFADVVR
jgi:hypothetical protein